ncbi:MAG: GntP family permease [Thermoguttaceae bacterium]|nr:GntP family permease [Thermoguttaceae bacterium]
MLSGMWFLIVFAVLIVLMVVAISVLHIHPFLSMMATAFILAFLCLDLDKIVDAITAGFATAFATVGLLIFLGSLIGLILERTGAAFKMGEFVVKIVGKKRPTTSIALMGWFTSMVIVSDSGFVVLNPVRKAIVMRIGVSSVAMTTALATSLAISHCMIPPAAAPLAAASILGLENKLLWIIFFGVLVSIPALIVTLLYANFIGKRIKSETELKVKETSVLKTYEELLASYGKLPNTFMSFLPILIPMALMGTSSICAMNHIEQPIVEFLGKPVIALTAGLFAALALLRSCKKKKTLYELTSNALNIAGSILFITGAGCALGKVVSESPLIPFLTNHHGLLDALGIFFPFIFAAILKTSQGSSTVAVMTTSNVVLPLLPQLGLDSPALMALTVTAIGAGAMTVSHVNDSYFWIVSKLGGIQKTEDVFKTLTISTLLVGVTSILTIFVISLFL